MTNGTGEALAILSQSKNEIIRALFRHFEVYYGGAFRSNSDTLVDLLDAWSMLDGAWRHLLRSNSLFCGSCGGALGMKFTCRECDPPDGEE